MITQWLLNFCYTFLGQLYALVPPVPSWFTSAIGNVGTVWGWVYSFNGWLPVTDAAISLPIVLAFYVSMIGVRTARIVVSNFTGGGGAAS